MDMYKVQVVASKTLPPGLMSRLKQSYIRVERRLYAGTGRHCEICDRDYRTFKKYNGRPQARCPGCRSLERHRLVWRLMQTTDVISSGGRVLHFAPEPSLEARFRATSLHYVTADLLDKAADLRLDVSAIDLPSSSFDLVICSHVLEHVPDDEKAMRELARITAPDGWAVLDTPFSPALETTFEDPAIETPKARREHYGQWDHVRLYGRDLADKLTANGWEIFTFDESGDLRAVGPENPLTDIYAVICGRPRRSA